jgi:hypothetical protein
MKNLIVITIISISILLTGCPKASIQSVKENSKKVAGYANAGVEITRELYRAGKLTLAQKDLIADGFIALAVGGLAFDAAVMAAEKQYAGNVPKDAVKQLLGVFNQEVVAKLVDLLSKIKPGFDSQAFHLAIEGIKTSVILIAGVFGQRKQVAAQIN